MTVAANQTIVTDGTATAALSKGFLQPGNVITTDWTNGRPNFEVVPVNEPGQMGVTLWNLIQQQKERATISSENIGGVGTQDKTATQANIEANAAADLVSLFRKLMELGIREKKRLTFPNICQFYTMPIHSKDGDKFKQIILRDQKMTNGQTGTVHVRITPNPSQQNVETLDNGVPQKTEFIEITPDFIRNWEAEVEIIEGSSIKKTEEQEQNAEITYQKVMNELYPDKFNRDAGFEELNLKYRKDPEKMKAQTPLGEGAGMETGIPGGLAGFVPPNANPKMQRAAQMNNLTKQRMTV